MRTCVTSVQRKNNSLAPVLRGEGWGEGPNRKCRNSFSAVPWVAAGWCLWLWIATAAAAGPDDPAAPGGGGGQIIFSSNRSGPWRIWTIRPDGSELRELTQAGADEQDVDPVISPDGQRVLFTSTRGGRTGIWRMTLDSPKPERICDGDQAEWSPDAARIVLRRDEQIWSRELATGREQGLSPQDWPHCSGPAWSPDGRRIAFACRWEAGNAIFLVAAAGGPPQPVYDKQGACEPHWSPDGKRLVYETESHLYTIDPDGKKNRPVTYFGGVQRYGRFNPDGKWIVYCQGVSERGPWELYRIPSSGGTPVRLTEEGSDLTPDWK